MNQLCAFNKVVSVSSVVVVSFNLFSIVWEVISYSLSSYIQLCCMIADIHRTFPDNINFKDVPSDPKANVDALFNVLVALAHNNRKVGYCQVSELLNLYNLFKQY